MKSKRSLGQNFFINKNLCLHIGELVLNNNPQVIIEIGPGKGAFTEIFSKSKTNLVLIEKDNQLIKDLLYKFPNSKVSNMDFLDWDFKVLKQYKNRKIVFFGSLPYNTSKSIIRKIISSDYFNCNSYFIIQKEVADKYITKEPNNSYLSLQTQFYATTRRLFNISPDSFRPKPKVNSSLICFSPNKKFPGLEFDSFDTFLKRCFIQPRKTLKNNLRGINFKESRKIEKILSKRAQHISLEDYVFLFSNISNLLI